MEKKKYYCSQCRSEIEYADNFCSECGTKNIHWLPEENRFCDWCGVPLKDNEQRCPICGHKQNEPDEYSEMFSEMYGPPPIRIHYHCPNKNCKHTWTVTEFLGKPIVNFCPKCGANLNKSK